MHATSLTVGSDPKPKLFTTPWWWRWALGTCFARITEPMATLALISLGTFVSGYSYGAFLVSVYAFVGALTATTSGKLIDRAAHPRRLVLIMTSSSFLLHVALAAFGTFRLSLVLITVTTALCAALPGGIPGLSRSVLVKYADPRLRNLAFSWDSIMTEAGWILGPVVIAGLTLFGLPWVEVAAMAVTFLGVQLFLGPLIGGGRSETPPDLVGTAPGSLWSYRTAWPGLVDSVSVGMAVTGVVSVLPALLPKAGASPAWSGILVSLLAGTGIAGTLVYGMAAGRIPLHITVQSLLTLIGVLTPVVALAFSDSLLSVAVWIGVAGFFITPFNTQRSISLEASIPPALHTQGFSAQFALFGLGSAISAGMLALISGVTEALLAIAGFALLISAVTHGAVRKEILTK
ncbi:MFS transporter [Streptomyces pratensis]|uniref:MFS transporter n=1 Tax=Streptomyces pratensis TaxID=1169025 RepID=UPI0037AB026E